MDLEWEDGWQGSTDHSLLDLETTATAELRGQRFIEKRLPLTASPAGYHTLRIRIAAAGGAAVESETSLIIAPEKAYLPSTLENHGRRAGL